MKDTALMEPDYLNPEEILFSLSDGGFLMMEQNGKRERAYLSRSFPHDLPYEYISVSDKEQNEIGILRSLDAFDEATRELLKKELWKKYYVPKIIRIDSISERFGYSYWEVETSGGKRAFSLKDTFRSLMRIGSDRLFVVDVDANRYEIESLRALDRKSYRKIELYL